MDTLLKLLKAIKLWGPDFLVGVALGMLLVTLLLTLL